jgi:predicted adenine nucleotide alpha hydrolase (AANH) superfamily ATPase
VSERCYPAEQLARTCTGKVRYRSGNDAGRAKRRLSEDMKVYRCPYCHCWHLTKRQRPAPKVKHRRRGVVRNPERGIEPA